MVEWLSDEQSIVCMLTTIDSAGMVSAHWLVAPDATAAALPDQLQQRLKMWHLKRQGSPFDLPEWRAQCQWLGDQLRPYLDEYDHVVFIHHPSKTRLPWHVAAAGHGWTSSYASGWSSLLAPKVTWRPPAGELGVLCASLFSDSKEVVLAISDSVGRTRELSSRKGLKYTTYEGPNCDAESFKRVLESADVAKIICHGFVDQRTNEVAFMVSHEGRLPPSATVAVGSEALGPHRLSWRSLQELKTAPSLVVSGACSSGRSYIAGLGENLGVLSGLQRAGTSSILAPKWDVVAEAFLPIIDDVLERILTTDVTLARAVLMPAKSGRTGCQIGWLGQRRLKGIGNDAS